MIDMPKERETLFKEFQAFTVEKYIPYQVALMANHDTFIENEKTLQAFQQQTKKELQEKSWQMVQQAANELDVANSSAYQAIKTAYEHDPTKENFQQIIGHLMRAAQTKQTSIPPEAPAA